MEKRTKTGVIKGIVIFIYVCVLIMYVIFNFSKYLVGVSRVDFDLFGNGVCALNTGEAAIVDYELLPSEGDTVVVEVGDAKKLAIVNSMLNEKTAVLELDYNENKQYYSSSISEIYVVKQLVYALGDICSFFKSFWGCVFVLIVPCIFFLFYEIFQLVKTIKEENKLAHFMDTENLENDKDVIVLEKMRRNSKMKNKDNDDNKNNSYDVDYFKKLDGKTGPLYDTVKVNDNNSQDDNVSECEQKNDLFSQYGINAENIDGGVKLKMDPKSMESMELKLMKDGSLTIVTDKYTTNVDLSE